MPKMWPISMMIVLAMVLRCSSWSFGPMSPELWKKANKNWNATMTSYRANGYTATEGACSSDVRQQTPACLQYEQDWCWATGVAELAAFWKPDDFPAKGNDCHGQECRVVSYKNKGDESSCCNGTAAASNFCGDDASCCRTAFGSDVSCVDKCRGFAKKVDGNLCMEDSCKRISGSNDDILKALMNFTGKSYVNKTDGPLSPQQLDTILSKGSPLIISVRWSMTAGHALTLAGCASGGGPYYLHDPLDKAGVYQTLSYDQVAEYIPPWDKSYRGQWFETYYPEGSLPEVEKSIVV